MVNGVDKLKHEVTDMLRLEGTAAGADCFVEVTVAAQLENDVLVVVGLEIVHEVDDVWVRTEVRVDLKLLRAVVDSDSGGAGVIVLRCVGLGDAFDGDVVASTDVASSEDHTERAMVEW